MLLNLTSKRWRFNCSPIMNQKWHFLHLHSALAILQIFSSFFKQEAALDYNIWSHSRSNKKKPKWGDSGWLNTNKKYMIKEDWSQIRRHFLKDYLSQGKKDQHTWQLNSFKLKEKYKFWWSKGKIWEDWRKRQVN